jgi:predicted flap endonuclease-1-like 5' DNA nuclease
MTGSSSEQQNDLPKISAPAGRALASAGIEGLEQLATFSEDEIKRLHGIGPNALAKLRAALKERGLSFAAR